MSNSKEKFDLTTVYTEKQLINELFRQNLAMQAHIQTLHGTVVTIFAEVFKKTDAEVTDMILEEINKRGEKILKDNEYLQAARQQTGQKKR